MNIKSILSLCDITGNWSNPYKESGYNVIRIDIMEGSDVRLMSHLQIPIHGILAAPPCTVFSKVGARYWKDIKVDKILDGLSIVDACLRAVAIYKPKWWALENPIGRLRNWLGPPVFTFQPYMYGDPWTKRTNLWGEFCPPLPLFSDQAKSDLRPTLGDITTRLSGRDKIKRSATPEGFARAFFQANP